MSSVLCVRQCPGLADFYGKCAKCGEHRGPHVSSVQLPRLTAQGGFSAVQRTGVGCLKPVCSCHTVTRGLFQLCPQTTFYPNRRHLCPLSFLRPKQLTLGGTGHESPEGPVVPMSSPEKWRVVVSRQVRLPM